MRRVLDPNETYERHHILPRSMGGSNDSSNIVTLTLREHFIAHWLLWKIYEKYNNVMSRSAAFAFHCMCVTNSKRITSSIGYAEARKAYCVSVSLHRSGMKFTDEHKKNIGTSSKGRISIWRRKVLIEDTEFESLHKAAEILKMPVNTIRNRIFNKNFQTWSYIDDAHNRIKVLREDI